MFGENDIVAFRDGKSSIICPECATDEEQADVEPWNIIREGNDIQALRLGENSLICARCGGVIWPIVDEPSRKTRKPSSRFPRTDCSRRLRP